MTWVPLDTEQILLKRIATWRGTTRSKQTEDGILCLCGIIVNAPLDWRQNKMIIVQSLNKWSTSTLPAVSNQSLRHLTTFTLHNFKLDQPVIKPTESRVMGVGSVVSEQLKDAHWVYRNMSGLIKKEPSCNSPSNPATEALTYWFVFAEHLQLLLVHVCDCHFLEKRKFGSPVSSISPSTEKARRLHFICATLSTGWRKQ